MNKTRIEWCDYTINPVKGLCPMACSYCYARRMYKRFKWNPSIRYDPSVFIDLPNRPSRIFVGSTMELFGEWNYWMDEIISLCQRNSEHTFIFLTKQPQNLIKWSPFPENCRVGATVTDRYSYERALKGLSYVDAKVRFLSFEPLLGYVAPLGRDFDIFHWVVIGQQTPVKKATMPKIEWIREIVDACDKAKIPVFQKNNLFPSLIGYGELRQEFPR